MSEGKLITRIDVPLRKVELFQADDGRKIERYSQVDVVAFPEDSPNKLPENFQFSKEKYVYVGVVVVGTPMGPKEIKFEIPGVKDNNDLVQAFSLFHKYAKEATEKLQKKFEEARAEIEKQKIVTAPASALNELNGVKV